MKIELYKTIIEDEEVSIDFDTLLSFDQQTELTKDFIKNICNTTMPLTQLKEQAGFHGRVVEQVFKINEELNIKVVWNYMYPYTSKENGIIKNIEYAMVS